MPCTQTCLPQQLRFGVFREGVFQKMPALEGQISRGQKRHINIWHINFFCHHSPPVCPRDNPGLSQGQTGLPLCKIMRKPRFVPGTTWVLSLGQTGFVPGTIEPGVDPSATGPKRLCLCAFFLPENFLKEISVRFAGENHLRTQKNTKQSSAQRFLNDPFPKTPFLAADFQPGTKVRF